MPKVIFLLLALLCLLSNASAATRYVSDNLYTYIHSGPGTKYKIIGSVNAGEHINVIKKNADSDFTLIKDSKGRSGWINSKYVSNTIGIKERLPKLEAELAKLNLQLSQASDKANNDKASLEKNLKSRNNQVLNLQNTTAALKEQLQEIQALNRDLNAKLDTKKNDLLMRWFTYGGMVAGAGLLLGLLLPILIPNRRTKKRW